MSAGHLLSRLSGRILRRVIGLQREPVRQWTEADLRRIDHAYALLVSLIAAGLVVAGFVTFYAGQTC
jgi:hypothetical protein